MKRKHEQFFYANHQCLEKDSTNYIFTSKMNFPKPLETNIYPLKYGTYTIVKEIQENAIKLDL